MHRNSLAELPQRHLPETGVYTETRRTYLESSAHLGETTSAYLSAIQLHAQNKTGLVWISCPRSTSDVIAFFRDVTITVAIVILILRSRKRRRVTGMAYV